MSPKGTPRSSFTRILALDLHPRRFGYVVIETPGKLVDWGVRRSYLKTKNHPEVLARRRLRLLLELWLPDIVVARVGTRRNKEVQILLKQIRKEMDGRRFLTIRADQGPFVNKSKYERAREVAAIFSEISWKLPARRKFVESEHYSMSIFEALAVAAPYGSTSCASEQKGAQE